MSGHKRTTITLSQEEYRKLHEAEMRLRFMNEGMPEIVDQAKQQINQQMQTDLQDMQFRQEALLDSLDQVNREISTMEGNTSQALVDQHLRMQADLADAIGNYHINTETALATIEDQVQSQIGEIIHRHSLDWEWLENEWQQHTSGRELTRQQAGEWIQSASILEQFIVENYDHDRFAPGALQHYVTRLNQAQQNFDHNYLEAAISSAQDAYNNLSALRIELEKRQTEYHLLLNRVQLESEKIRMTLDGNKVVPAIDLEGKALPFDITVNYWSDGNLDRLADEFESVMEEMVETTQPVSSEELVRLLSDYFPCIEDKVADLVFEARMKVINAQLRMNIAEIVVNALAGQGYSLNTSFFISDDERDAYQANLVNYEGSQVVVKVDPVQAQEAINELHIFTSDAQEKSSHELKQRALEIRRALQSSGLEVGTITATRSTPENVFSQTDNPQTKAQKRQAEKETQKAHLRRG